MDIKILASGSSGNSYRISDGKTCLLLDAGIPFSKLQAKLSFRMSEIDACLISHAHKDHSNAATDLSKAGIDVYTSAGTIEACKLTGHRIHALLPLPGALPPYMRVSIGTFEILPFDVAHDAPDPVGFLITSNETKEKLLFFTDTFYLKYRFPSCQYIMAECNYDRESLQHAIDTGYVPEIVAKRVFKSHMSLDNLIEMLKANDLSKIKQIYLMHLSQNNSNEKRFKEEIQKVTGAEVYVC